MLNSQQQKGVALIAMMLIVFMLGTSMFFTVMNNRTGKTNERVEASKQLALAKESLIAFAINYSTYYPTEGPGRLPCPDIYNTGTPNTDADGDGDEAGDGELGDVDDRFCNAPLYRYRLPAFMTLPTGSRYTFNDYFTNTDYQFWYAVSPSFAAEGGVFVNTPLNSSTPGAFSLNGQNDIAAVIIAPGEALDGQNRPSNFASNDYLAYLESTNATDSSAIFTSSNGLPPESFNDQVIGISRSEIMSGVTAKVIQEIKPLLDDYYDDYACVGTYYGFFNYNYPCYPQSADFNNVMTNKGIPVWFTADQWDIARDYQMTPAQIGDPGINDDYDLLVARYLNAADGEATISFNGCNISYTLGRNDDISYTPNRC